MAKAKVRPIKYSGCKYVGPAAVGVFLIYPLSLAAMAGGTGASYSDTTLQHALQNVLVVESSPSAEYALSAAQHLGTIREVFGLTMSDMAQIFGVSRPAVYAWTEGTPPKASTFARISQLSERASSVRDAGVPDLRPYLRRPVLEGRSLLDLLKSGEDFEPALRIVQATAAHEMALRASARSRHFRDVPTVSGVDELIGPGVFEGE